MQFYDIIIFIPQQKKKINRKKFKNISFLFPNQTCDPNNFIKGSRGSSLLRQKLHDLLEFFLEFVTFAPVGYDNDKQDVIIFSFFPIYSCLDSDGPRIRIIGQTKMDI